MCSLLYLFFFAKRRQTGTGQCLEYEDGMMGGERTSRLDDEVGLLQSVLPTDIHQRIDGIVHILLNGIVDAIATHRRMCSVIVHAQSSPDIHKTDVVTTLAELGIELGDFLHGGLDAPDVGHLASDVEMDELEAIGQPLTFQQGQGIHQFARIETKLAGISSRLFPFPASRTGQLDADADIGADIHPLGEVGQDTEFHHLLYHDENLTSHFLGKQGQLDIAFVLVSVADDERMAIHVKGKDGMEFGFRACFQAHIVLVPVADEFLHHGAHLVHLDGIDNVALCLIVILLRSTFEAFRNLGDAVVQDVGET